MSTSSDVCLGALRLQAQQRTGLENNPVISTSEWNTYATASYTELYDLLVGTYDNYYLAPAYQFVTGNSQTYPLPDGTPTYQNVNGQVAQKCYKVQGVDLQYTGSPSGWISIQRFEFIQRNNYAYPNTTTNLAGYTNLKYTLQGSNLWIIPYPVTGQLMQLWYTPAPTALQYTLPTVIASGGTICSLSDTTGLSIGMNAAGTGVATNATITNLSANSVTLSAPVTATNPSAVISYWNDSTSLDGIAGWQEYVIVDMCIKAQVKQEFDFAGFAGQKADMKMRIESMAPGRDSGQASHVSDALAVNAYGANGFGGGGDWGSGGGWW